MSTPEFKWFEDSRVAECVIKYKNIEFLGMACCHDEDLDMCSKLTGYHIAETRAIIQILEYQRDCEIKPQLQSLKQLYYSIDRSKYFNPKSYEAKALFRQINRLENELIEVTSVLRHTRSQLSKYIAEKEKFYMAVRKHRETKTV